MFAELFNNNFRGSLNFSWRKLLTNLFYFVLFIAVRTYLLKYLTRLRADLHESMRDDLVQLKYVLFEQPSLQQLADDEYYGNLNKRRALMGDYDHDHDKVLRKQAIDLEPLFDSVMAESNFENDPDLGTGKPQEMADYDDIYGSIEVGEKQPLADVEMDTKVDGDEEDEEEEDEEGDATDELIGSLFASMMGGGRRARADGASGGPGGAPPLDLGKLMGSLGGFGGGGGGGGGENNMPDLSELFGGQDLNNMDMGQLQDILKTLMSVQPGAKDGSAEAGLDPTTILEDKSEPAPDSGDINDGTGGSKEEEEPSVESQTDSASVPADDTMCSLNKPEERCGPSPDEELTNKRDVEESSTTEAHDEL